MSSPRDAPIMESSMIPIGVATGMVMVMVVIAVLNQRRTARKASSEVLGDTVEKKADPDIIEEHADENNQQPDHELNDAPREQQQYMTKPIRELLARLKELGGQGPAKGDVIEKSELVARILHLESLPKQPPPATEPASTTNGIDTMSINELKSLIEMLGGDDANSNPVVDITSLRQMARSMLANENDTEQDHEDPNTEPSTTAPPAQPPPPPPPTTDLPPPSTMTKKQIQKAEKKKTAAQQREYLEYMNAERKKKDEARRAKEDELEKEREKAFLEKQQQQQRAGMTTQPSPPTSTTHNHEREPTDHELISKLISLTSTIPNNHHGVMRIDNISTVFSYYASNPAQLPSLKRRLKSLPQPLTSSSTYSLWCPHDDEYVLLVNDESLLQLAERIRATEHMTMNEATKFLVDMS